MQKNLSIQTLNPYLVCTLCAGYLIDATTLVECLHSFCKSCLLKYLENSYDCPKCGIEIHKTKPLEYIRSDPCLQEIVWKLVPDLFSKEEVRKHAWKKEEEKNGNTVVDLGGPSGVKEDLPDDSRILVTLKYFRGTSRMERIKTEKVLQMFPTRYLCCSPEMPVGVLKKFVCLKFDISPGLFNVELWRGDETLCDSLSLKQLVQIFGLFRERKPLDLHFSLYPKFEVKPHKPPEVRKPIPRFDPAAQLLRNKAIDAEKNSEEGKDEVKKEETELQQNGFDGEKISPNKDIESKPVSPHPNTAINEENKHTPDSLKNTNIINGCSENQQESQNKRKVTLDDSMSLKEELKSLTASSSKNNTLNTTDSDSSQKSNVSSLDVNMLMEDDLKNASETLENDFLKLFDSDSQHNSDIDVSCFDGNLSIMDSDIEKITDSLDSDILNLFDTDDSRDIIAIGERTKTLSHSTAIGEDTKALSQSNCVSSLNVSMATETENSSANVVTENLTIDEHTKTLSQSTSVSSLSVSMATETENSSANLETENIAIDEHTKTLSESSSATSLSVSLATETENSSVNLETENIAIDEHTKTQSQSSKTQPQSSSVSSPSDSIATESENSSSNLVTENITMDEHTKTQSESSSVSSLNVSMATETENSFENLKTENINEEESLAKKSELPSGGNLLNLDLNIPTLANNLPTPSDSDMTERKIVEVTALSKATEERLKELSVVPESPVNDDMQLLSEGDTMMLLPDTIKLLPALPEIFNVSRLNPYSTNVSQKPKQRKRDVISQALKGLEVFGKNKSSEKKNDNRAEAVYRSDTPRLSGQLTVVNKGFPSSTTVSSDMQGNSYNANLQQTTDDCSTGDDLVIDENSGMSENYLLHLLESGGQNDSDANSSMENDIKNISASLEKDILNLLDSESSNTCNVAIPSMEDVSTSNVYTLHKSKSDTIASTIGNTSVRRICSENENLTDMIENEGNVVLIDDVAATVCVEDDSMVTIEDYTISADQIITSIDAPLKATNDLTQQSTLSVTEFPQNVINTGECSGNTPTTNVSVFPQNTLPSMHQGCSQNIVRNIDDCTMVSEGILAHMDASSTVSSETVVDDIVATLQEYDGQTSTADSDEAMDLT